MAKKILTASSVSVDNVRNLPDIVKDQSTTVKTAMDQYGIDDKSYNNNTLLPELQSEVLNDSGAHAIGLKTTNSTETNVGDQIEAILQAGTGTIPPDGSITNAKLATDVKVGSLASLDTTDKTSVVNAINEDLLNLDILRISKTDTGSANAYVVNTDGTFERVDGNSLTFIPSNTNTGSSTLNEDGNGLANIKKYVDGAWIDLEPGDINKFQRVDVNWNASESAFQLAPKKGAVIRSIQRGVTTIPFNNNIINVTISAINLNNSIVKISHIDNRVGTNPSADQGNVRAELTSTTNLQLVDNALSGSGGRDVYWEVVEFNNVKSVQRGNYSVNVTTEDIVNISSVDISKSIIFASHYHNSTLPDTAAFLLKSRIISATQIGFQTSLIRPTIHWQVIEFR